MKAAQLAPHGKVEWPRWHPERHPSIHRVFGTHGRLAGLAGLVLIVALAILGASASGVLGPNRSAGVSAISPAQVAALEQSLTEAREFQALKSSVRISPEQMAALEQSLAEAREFKALKSSVRISPPQMTALQQSLTEAREIQKLKSMRGWWLR